MWTQKSTERAKGVTNTLMPTKASINAPFDKYEKFLPAVQEGPLWREGPPWCCSDRPAAQSYPSPGLENMHRQTPDLGRGVDLVYIILSAVDNRQHRATSAGIAGIIFTTRITSYLFMHNNIQHCFICRPSDSKMCQGCWNWTQDCCKGQPKLVYDDEQQCRSKDSKDGRCEGSGFPICQNRHQKAFLCSENGRKSEQLAWQHQGWGKAGNIQAEIEAIESLDDRDRAGDSKSDGDTGLDIKKAKRTKMLHILRMWTGPVWEEKQQKAKRTTN